MRLAGWFLLLAGLLLCLTVAWATVGFLLMGVGLIALRSAERRRLRPAVVASVAADFAAPVEPVMEMPVAASPARVLREPARPDPALSDTLHEPGVTPPRTIDTVRWHVLLRKDPEIARLADILTPYGARYVEQLASDYLAAGDKNALPEIIAGIIARARADKAEADRLAVPEPVAVPPAAGDASPPRESTAYPPRREPVFEMPVVAAAPVASETALDIDETVIAAASADVVLEAHAAADVVAPVSPLTEVQEPSAPLPAASEPVAAAYGPAPIDVSAALAEARIEPHQPAERMATISPPDDALAELIEKFAPDSGFLKGGLSEPKPL